MKITLFWLACILVIGGRFAVPGHGLSLPGTYEAFAHIWVGAMIGAWWLDRKPKYLWALGVASVVEIIMVALLQVGVHP